MGFDEIISDPSNGTHGNNQLLHLLHKRATF
jgi:hypothetical protein